MLRAATIAFASLAGCSLVVPLDDLRSDAQVTPDASDVAVVETSVDAPAESSVDAGSKYVDQVLADAPLAYYRLDEGGGTIATDSSGFGRDCTYVGGVSFGAKGAIANDTSTAVTFDGNTGWVDCGQLFAFSGTAPFTVEMWIHATIDGTYRGIFGKNAFDVDAATSGTGVHAYISSLQPDAGDNHITFERLIDSQTKEAAYALGIPQTGWIHMVAIYDAANVRLYVNATLGGSGTSSSSIAATSNPFLFGSANAYTPFNGSIDEVAIYATALAPNRILAHYNVGIGLPP